MLFRWYPVAMGAAVGIGAAALLAVLTWAALAALGWADGSTGPVLVGILIGMVAGGYVAGRLGHRSVYHGGMAGLAVSAAVVFMSLTGGSPAPPTRLVIVFGLGLLLGATGGALAGRRRSSYPGEASTPNDRGLRPEESPDSTGQDAG